jgi:hypothetical protein
MVRAKALTLQQFTGRPNNDRRSLGSLELIFSAARVISQVLKTS